MFKIVLAGPVDGPNASEKEFAGIVNSIGIGD
jgi:hypothetical protein